MWTLMVAVAIGGRGVDANLRILQVQETGWRIVGRVALLNRARKRRGVVQFPWELAEGSFPTEPVTSEAHPYPHRLWPICGRRTRIKYVIGLTGLAEAFRHSWYQSKKFQKWLIEEIGVVEEMIQRRVLSV
ncbi:hypothetical protein Taro_054837 [Colocasia esculenta]|uniref:Uncharacterized protein n=1 Tax=Colocasia esculenta TaxID=4460 RepID=A0A843XRN7_COLES|nr:hypothetical protein [Colocasia esculenta]